MKKFLYCFGAIALLSACNQKTENKDTVKSTITNSNQTDFSGLYSYQQNGDTITLQLTVDGTKAKGNLLYALNEKDRNSGSFVGEIKHGILLANYTFSSEGVLSERQIAFKLNDNSAVEGYGDVQEINGKIVFKDPANLEYGTGLVLAKK
ncbi:hypothetical protein SAMN05421741_10262 [Paenimyroides ummariense]|uniref:Type IV secretion system putative lipoprotein virB7 n=1 Tax=Paenimyroides ummariense TaxID=913024 RepID=A0A1I4X2U4_9FLAO|nr:lipoprotein [Paenimyroides ummariense]SFN19680.1 hypothetical protein SAMN05421741_10262 [Paenimyroides ummariense]